MNSSIHFDRNETEYYLRVGMPLFVLVMSVHGERKSRCKCKQEPGS